MLGESIAEVGSAASKQAKPATAISGALLALVLSAAMWWLYFGRDEHDSEALLEQVPANRRRRAAVYSFGYADYVIIFGIAVAAVGMQKAIDSFQNASVSLPAALLPIGTALFLVGLACFHRTLLGCWLRARLWTAVAVGALVTPAAMWISGAAAPVLLLALILWEARCAHVADR